MAELRPLQMDTFDDAPVPTCSGWWLPIRPRRRGGSWESPWVNGPSAQPYGVGSNRSMGAFGVTFDQTILAWEENSRFAFRVDKAAMPAVKAFADEWRFDRVGTQRTRIGWTIAADAAVPNSCLRLFLTAGMQMVLRIM